MAPRCKKPRSTRRGLLASVAALIWCLCARAEEKKPNIILLLVDDVDHVLGSDSPDRMPEMAEHLAQKGVNFTNYFVNFALCCPSRVSLLTGRCSHNTGVVSNLDTGLLAGEERFIEQGHEDRTLAVWLQSAGYRTGLVGKYLNGYGATPGVDPNHVPRGWDDWLAFVDIDYFNWTASDNGRRVAYGAEEGDYSTDVLKRRALAFVEESAHDERPFFLYHTPYAAHAPEIPAPRHDGHFRDLKIPRTPNWPGLYDGIRDKVTALRLYPPFQDKYLRLYDFIYQKRAETLLAVDEMIDELVRKLEATGQLANTYIFLTSDNGYHLGHHRMSAGKTAPYEENIHLFLYVRGPNVPQGIQLPHMVGNIDLAPTIADLAGARLDTPPHAPTDGISFAPLLRDPTMRDRDPEGMRAGFLVEKMFLDSDPTHITDQIVVNDQYHDPFAGYRPATPSFWEEDSWPAPPPPPPHAAVGPGDENYDNNIVNRGDELTPDGRALRNGPFGPSGSPAGHNFAAYYEKHGFNATDYANGVAFNFPSTYYGLRIINKRVGNLLYLECGHLGHELYDLERDPYQLHNAFRTSDPSLIAFLQNLLDKLKYCKGSATCSPTARSMPPFLFDVTLEAARSLSS